MVTEKYKPNCDIGGRNALLMAYAVCKITIIFTYFHIIY